MVQLVKMGSDKYSGQLRMRLEGWLVMRSLKEVNHQKEKEMCHRLDLVQTCFIQVSQEQVISSLQVDTTNQKM